MTEEQSSDDKRSRIVEVSTKAGAAGLSIVGAVVGAYVAGPQAAAVGATAGASPGLVELGWMLLRRKQRRIELVDEGVAERLGQDEAVEAARERVVQDENLAALTLQAFDASLL